MQNLGSCTLHPPRRRYAGRLPPAARPGESLRANGEVEASTVIIDRRIVDAQEEGSSFLHVEGLTGANKEKSSGHNANRDRVLGAINRLESRALNP